MADKKYDLQSIEEIETEILSVRIEDISLEKELCYTLNEKAKLANDHYALAFSYTFLGDTYLAMRENTSAVHYLKLAETLSESNNYEDLLIHIYNFMGMYYYTIYDEVTSIDYHLKSLYYAKKENNAISMSSSYNNMATCFELKNNYEEAMRYYHKSYDILKNLSDDYLYRKILSLGNLCSCAFYLRKTDEIFKYLNEFNNITENNDTLLVAFFKVYCTMLSQFDNEDHNLLYQAADQFFIIESEIDSPLLIYQTMLNVCTLFLEIKSKKYAEKSIKVIQKVNHEEDLKSQKEVQKFIIRYCQLFEDEARLNKEYEKFYDIIMAIENMQQETRIAGLLAKIELFKAKEKQESLKQEKFEMELLMNVDDLTDINNRRSFNHALDELKAGSDEMIAIAMLDLDNFKEFNDSYGHQKGDEALVEVGKALKKISNEDVQAYRYGGDEFSIIFKNLDETAVKQILNQLCQDVLDKKIVHCNSYVCEYLSVSYGYAISSAQDEDIDQLLYQADQNLYAIKDHRKRVIN